MPILKKCKKCQFDLPEGQFYVRKSGLADVICRACVRKKRQQYYLANREACLNRARANPNVPARRKAFRDFLDEAKTSRPCADCGNKFPSCVMDFDHMPGKKKSFCLGHAASCSLETVKREIAKCELVCANCHRMRTHRRKGIKNQKNG